MKMNSKNKIFIRVMCWILAGLMAAGAASTVLFFLFA